jgi:hypothetical protein
MAVANALVPIQTFLPSFPGAGSGELELGHRRERPFHEDPVRVYRPHKRPGMYGSDGREVQKVITGRLVDLYA